MIFCLMRSEVSWKIKQLPEKKEELFESLEAYYKLKKNIYREERQMLLAVVGNTNITLGVYKGEELIGTFRMTSNNPEHLTNMES